MFYGASGQIPVARVDELATRRVPLLVHRRNVGRPAVFLPAPGSDAGDILTKQIVARTHSPKRAYIARTLVRERFRRVADTFPLPDTAYRRLARTRTLGQVRLWEAEHSRKYWRKYFVGLGHPDVTRRGHAGAGVRRKSRTGCPAIFRFLKVGIATLPTSNGSWQPLSTNFVSERRARIRRAARRS